MQEKKQNNINFLQICINLARKNRGKTSPNPCVGCVITKNNKILATGVTSRNGRPHAEFNAINKIADKSILNKATLYVSLEPCCHHGQTLPCTDLIIENKISKVVIAAIDPDKRMEGKSVEILRKNGVEVEIIELEEAYEINKAFFKAISSKTPYITLKIASSMDGKIALNNDQSKWITSDKSRKYGHYLRYLNDAILIGKNTLIKDNPSLNCRIKGLEDNSPTKIIITNKLDFDLNYQLFNSGKIIIIYADSENNRKTVAKSNNHKIKFIAAPSKNNLIDLNYCLKELNKISINSILVEGGSIVSTILLQENLVDELIWFKSSKIIGSDGKNAINTMNFTDMNDVIKNFILKEVRKIDDTDSLAIYKRGQ